MVSNTGIVPNCVLVQPKDDSDPRFPLVDGVRKPLVMFYDEYRQFKMEENSQHRGSPSTSVNGASYRSSPPLVGVGGKAEVEPVSPFSTSPFRYDDPATLPDLNKNKQRETAAALEESFDRLTFGPNPYAPGQRIRPIPFPRATGMVDIAGNFIPLDPRRGDGFLSQRFDASDLPPSPVPSHTAVYQQPMQPAQPENGYVYYSQPVPTTWPSGLVPAVFVQPPPGLMELQQRLAHDQGFLRRAQHPHDNTFRPMQAAVTRLQPAIPAHSIVPVGPVALLPHQAADPMEKVMNGFSPNYMGNIHIDKNKSANIHENENCSLWLTKLPPNLTYTDLLAAIRGTGRVYQTHINRPVPDQGHHTSAGKVVFFDRASAERFFSRFANGGLVIPGYPGFTGRIAWNRVLAAAVDGPNTRDLSRVLLISGPKQMVDADFLTQYFRSKLDFNIDCIIDHGGDDYRATIEYRFASYRCQAESAKMAITRELGRHNVQVWFWTDPCDVGADSRRRVGGQLLAGSADQDYASGQHPARTAIAWR